MQSATVGLAVGLFDAEMWIDLETSALNGFTYAMGAFFVQGIAYYIFKMLLIILFIFFSFKKQVRNYFWPWK